MVGITSILTFDLIAGLAPVVTKFISFSLPGFLLVAIRFSFGAIFLFLFILATGKYKMNFFRVTKKQLFGLVFLGTGGSGIASFLYVVAIREVGAALATIFSNLEIPLGILFAVWFLGETVTARFLLFGMQILFGVVLVTYSGNIAVSWGTEFWIGIAASFLAAVLWGSCTVVGKKLLGKLSPTVVTVYRLSIASVFNSLMFFVITPGKVIPSIISVSPADWMKLLYLGVGVSGAGLLLYYKALQHLDVKQLSLLATLPIVIGVFLGVATGETFLFHQWIGAALVITGIIEILLWGKRTERTG